MTKCSDCGAENREGARFCNGCGVRIEPEIAEAERSGLQVAAEDQGLALSFDEDADANDSVPAEDADAGVPDATDEPYSAIDLVEAGGEGAAGSDDIEGEIVEEPLAEPLKTGYLVFPDSTEQPIPPSQWLIGRSDLAKFLPDPEKANEISRGHLTVFQEGERFFIEDGTTMVQRKPSANKTWLVRGGSRILVTGTGRNELLDEDEIDIAELVKLQVVVK